MRCGSHPATRAETRRVSRLGGESREAIECEIHQPDARCVLVATTGKREPSPIWRQREAGVFRGLPNDTEVAAFPAEPRELPSPLFLTPVDEDRARRRERRSGRDAARDLFDAAECLHLADHSGCLVEPLRGERCASCEQQYVRDEGRGTAPIGDRHAPACIDRTDVSGSFVVRLLDQKHEMAAVGQEVRPEMRALAVRAVHFRHRYWRAAGMRAPATAPRHRRTR